MATRFESRRLHHSKPAINIQHSAFSRKAPTRVVNLRWTIRFRPNNLDLLHYAAMHQAPPGLKKTWPRIKPYVVRVAAALLVLWLGFLGLVAYKMRQTPEEFGQFMRYVPFPAYFVLPFETFWTQARSGNVQVGDTAPEFRLKSLDKTTEVALSDFRGKSPVVLVFGSYT